jgi:hypothetical protein
LFLLSAARFIIINIKMNDFADFSQQEAFPAAEDGFAQMNGGVQMSSQEDVFADAGLPSMSTNPDMSQGFGGGSPAPADDYTEEEQQLLR